MTELSRSLKNLEQVILVFDQQLQQKILAVFFLN